MKVVFFGASPSIVKWAYKDIYDNSEIEYCEYDANSSMKGLKKLLVCTGKGKLLPYALKDRLYKKIFDYKFLNEKEKNILFVFTCQNGLFYQGGFFTFVNYLKSKYKKCKCVFYYNDLISTCEPTKIEGVKSVFDLVLTFDNVEAQKYGISYYGVVHSKALPSNDETAEDSDIFYVGSDRGRYDDIIKSFTIFADSGKHCVFYIFDLLKENEKKLNAFTAGLKKQGNAFVYKNSLLYVNEYCWYSKTLLYISKTKCMFEVLLPSQTAGTLRLAESVMYGKKLITNCKTVKEKPYYRAENILVFDKPDDIDVKFLDVPYVPVEYDFSPLKMVEYAKNKLFKEVNK